MRVDPRASRGSVALFAALALSACTVPHAYLVAPDELERVRGLEPAARAAEAVAATRVKGGQGVRVAAGAIDLSSARPDAGGRTRVVARARSRLVTAGSVLTLIGSAVSIAGTLCFFLAPTGDTHLAGLVMSPLAEPLMISGTIMWIYGSTRHPQELP